jgi:hypothetical protein
MARGRPARFALAASLAALGSAVCAPLATGSEPSPPTNISTPSIAGQALEGQVLTESPGLWTGEHTSSVQWEDCVALAAECWPISGAETQTYRLMYSDLLKAVRVQEAAANSSGTSQAYSASTPAVAPRAPSNVSSPVVYGSTLQGQTLTAAAGTWDRDVTRWGYQWQLCDAAGNNCATLVGASNLTYTLSGADVGHTLRVQVIASNAGGSSAPALSAPSGPVAAVVLPPQYPYIPAPQPPTSPQIYSPSYRRYLPQSRRYRRGGRRYSGRPQDRGLSVYYCPYGRKSRASSGRLAIATAASTSHAGWPPKQCLKMDKGPPGQHHTIIGMRSVHNWLLGGYGSDTITGGPRGDVIWADYHPDGKPRQTAIIHAGNGKNFIYANDTRNYVWTGTNPKTVVHAHLSGIGGVIHCQSPGIVVYLSTASERHFKLDGCRHISHFSLGY